MNRKLRMGMVGGGKDAFIGAIHRHAAGIDGMIELKVLLYHIKVLKLNIYCIFIKIIIPSHLQLIFLLICSIG